MLTPVSTNSHLLRILGTQLRGKPCRAFDANLRVRSIAANRATYADVTIVCGALELDPADKSRQTVLNPTVLIEVQSPSTESDDRGPKLDAYQLIASVRAVLLVAQDSWQITVHERQADGTWTVATHGAGTIDIPAVRCQLPLVEVYEDLPGLGRRVAAFKGATRCSALALATASRTNQCRFRALC